MSTAFYSHPACRGHDMGAGHPECPQRLDAIADHLRATGLDLALDFHEAPPATAEQIERAHSTAYTTEICDLLQRLRDEGATRALDPDTVAGPQTLAAALHAAGAAVAATDEVIAGRAGSAFCAVRPPGHHATRDAAMGFCFFNNVAIAARHALDVHGLQRVAIVDFDVHHGNGTEDIIAGDERVLMCSIFQHPLYPYSGAVPKGPNMVNLPLAPYTRGPAVREAVEAQWLPALEAFRPEMLFVSAGFDAHREDELGQLGLIEADYAWITQRLVEVAERHARGRIVSCLEGGYALGALARSVAAHLRVLAGLA
ncbi:MAG: histone deacetylase family protein [Burkholderiales bacterium]|nr:histone deacetylase family protein [Burkholderiales bacterium]